MSGEWEDWPERLEWVDWIKGRGKPTVLGFTGDMEVVYQSYVVFPHGKDNEAPGSLYSAAV